MIDIIVARAEALCLLTAVHKARKAHKPTSKLMARLRSARAKVAAMEARHGQAR